MKRVKKEKDISWKLLAHDLGVSEHTVRYGWLKKGNTIPFSIFQKLIVLNKSRSFNFLNYVLLEDPFWGQRLGAKSKQDAYIRLPQKNTVDFAEFYGIMLGDGCIYSTGSGFCISSDSFFDKEFILSYVPALIYKLFNLSPHFYFPKNSRVVNCVVYNKKIVHFLIANGFPKGKKIPANPTIPSLFFKKPELLKACIRGIVDTDGSVSSHPHTKIMIHISIVSDTLRTSVSNGLKKLGMIVGTYDKGIEFYGKKKAIEYFRIIDSSNVKHKLKYDLFLQNNYVPKKKEMQEYLNEKRTHSLNGLVV